MKKFILLTIVLLYIVGCSKKENEYKTNETILLNGTIKKEVLYKDGEEIKKNILKLKEPITIDGISVSSVEITYDKDLKEQQNATIEGTLIENSNLDTTFGISITNIEDENIIENTFVNQNFSMTIPPKLIKLCTIKKIDNGFIVYSSIDYENDGEVFRIESISNKEFKELQNNEKAYIEKVSSNQEKTIIIRYPNTSKEFSENYETIGNSIREIKRNIKIKE